MPSNHLPSPPALNLSQHQGLYKWVSSLHQVAKVLEFQLQHQCGRPGFNPWVGKTPGEGKGYPLQYSGLENTVRGVAKSQTPQLYSLNFPLCTHKIQESKSKSNHQDIWNLVWFCSTFALESWVKENGPLADDQIEEAEKNSQDMSFIFSSFTGWWELMHNLESFSMDILIWNRKMIRRNLHSCKIVRKWLTG